MFTVRPAQMEALAAAQAEAFVAEVAAHLRAADIGGTAGMGDSELYRRVAASIARGRRLGLETRGGLYLFTGMLFDVGPGLAVDALFLETLASPLPEPERVKRAHDYVYFESIVRHEPFPEGSWDEV